MNIQPMDCLEENVINGNNFNFVYEGESFAIPRKLMDVDFADIVNVGVIEECFTEEEKQELMGLLPHGGTNGQ